MRLLRGRAKPENQPPSPEVTVTRDDAIEQLRAEVADLTAQLASLRATLLHDVHLLTKRTHANGQPRTEPLSEVLREIPNLRWNMKLLGAELAGRLRLESLARSPDAGRPMPYHVGLGSKLCCQADLESPWMRHWLHEIRRPFCYSRKEWEYGYVLQCLWEAGMLEAGRSGLGFAVGSEPLPSYFASLGIRITATDLASNDVRSEGWRNTGQHADMLTDLHKPALVSEDAFRDRCVFRSVDMAAVPTDLCGQHDFCWSMCSFEHIGSIELGIEFVRNSVRCLKPGGIAVHSTEYSFEHTDETLDNWPCVLFQRRHVEELGRRLAADGHELVAGDYSPGTGALDAFIDMPPFFWQPHPLMTLPDTPHVRLSVDGFPTTSVGLIIRAGSA